MREFLAMYSKRNEEKINHDLFDRKFDRPLHEFVLDTVKNLEVLPAIKLDSWELITDQTKIRIIVNKKLNKDAKIKNNKVLETLVPINQTLSDLMVFHFTVTAKGRSEEVTRRMLIPKELPGHFYILGGKRVTIINQVIDNSTFVKGDVLKFKTNQNFSVDISLDKILLEPMNGPEMKMSAFRVDLFKRRSNPLLYFLAKYGVMETIEMFYLDSVISLTYDMKDPDKYWYFHVCSGLYLEVHKKALKVHPFVPRFVASLYDAMGGDLSMTIDDVFSIDYWCGRLSELFVAKRQVSRGKKALISFSRLLDPTTKKRLKLKKHHRRNFHTLMRWLLTNFDELMRKDGHDLRFKRVRGNECIAYYFDEYITKNIYGLLNTNNPPFDRYLKLLNAINENALLKSGRSSSSGSPYRYEHYNDFDAIDAVRYSLKGPSGLNGGKHAISNKYKDIYASHLGRYDLNVCSSGSPGLTGYLTANCQLDDNGYFDKDYREPDMYEPVIDALLENIVEQDYAKKRSRALVHERRDENGFYMIKPIRTTQEILQDLSDNPRKFGFYAIGDRLFPIQAGERDAKGFYVMKPKDAPVKDVGKRDSRGFYIMEPIAVPERQRKKRR